MTEGIREILNYSTQGFWIRQAAVTACLFFYGFALLYSLRIFRISPGNRDITGGEGEVGDERSAGGAAGACRDGLLPEMAWLSLLAFPAGLSAYALSGLALLLSGIEFTALSVLVCMGAVLAAVYLAAFFIEGTGSLERLKMPGGGKTACSKRLRRLIMAAGAAAAVFAIALFTSSGTLPVSITNDSVYYYSTYPKVLSEEGYYFKELDVFLTDVGQSSAVINTLPFFFGFDETFGLQHFLNLNFLCVFFAAVYEMGVCQRRGAGNGKNRRASALSALLCTVFLATSQPFQVVSCWVLSNVYFMEYLFMCFILAVKLDRGDKNTLPAALLLFSANLSMLRMEGGVILAYLAVIASTTRITGRKSVTLMLLPGAVFQCGYYLMLFLRLGVDPLYSFLDPLKALFALGVYIAAFVYLAAVRKWLEKTEALNSRIIILLLLFAFNLLLLAVSSRRYLENLRAFALNIRNHNGWGYFGLVLALLSLSVLSALIKSRGRTLSFTDSFWIGLIMVITAVCWARGGTLVVRTTDSGNRVLLQIVPLVVYAAAEKAFAYTYRHRPS